MRHIKKFNELFDTEELKASHEIDYISNNIDKKKLVDSKYLMKNTKMQNLYSKIIMSCPIIKDLNPTTYQKSIYLKKDETIKFSEKDTVVLLCEIMITANDITNDYTLSYKIETLGNGHSLFNRSNNYGVMDYNKLISTINKSIKKDLIDWDNNTKTMFKRSAIDFNMVGLN